MEQAHLDILREAVERRLKKEAIERAVGKAIRNRGMEFSVYIRLMSEIREFAREHRLSEIDAARQLLRQGDDKT